LKFFSQIKTMMCNSNLNLFLLYKATRDGLSCKNFHSLRENQGPTICLIKSEFGKTFGGYAYPSWHSLEKGIYRDGKSFLFQLD
jgi:hypothetical protein